MKILNPNYIYINGNFRENIAVAFNSKIESIDSVENLKDKHQDVEVIDCGKNSVLYPGFINTHVHLEFSSNRTTLKYGNFMRWLNSVIDSRDELLNSCDNAMMDRACREMLNSGVTTFGAISSFGTELEVCENTPQKVIFFNELIGSNMAYIDALYNDFLVRVKASKEAIKNGIIPAIAIHSPYSVHPIALKRALDVAKATDMPISAHFLESPYEREWLEDASGEFLDFFKKYFNTTQPMTTIDEFLSYFDNTPTHFTHLTQAKDKELKYISEKGHSIAHCPRSNRFLASGRLDLNRVKDLNIPFTVATDGLSSNSSLNIFDELYSALMIHDGEDLIKLSKLLISSITTQPANIFNLNSGYIEKGRDADFAIVKLVDTPSSLDDIALYTILHTKKVNSLFIGGEQII